VDIANNVVIVIINQRKLVNDGSMYLFLSRNRIKTLRQPVVSSYSGVSMSPPS